MRRALVLAAAAAFAACSGGGEPIGSGGNPDSARESDAPAVVTLPTWRLEDIQPQSPGVGQTYGLDAFTGKTVVVTLVEGF